MFYRINKRWNFNLKRIVFDLLTKQSKTDKWEYRHKNICRDYIDEYKQFWAKAGYAFISKREKVESI